MPEELEFGELELLLLLLFEEVEPEVLTFRANGWLDWPLEECAWEEDGGS